MNITYRNFTEADVDQIIGFWNENSGWETDMDRKLFNDRFCSSHVGLPIIMLAIDNDIRAIVGIFSFIPISVTICNKERKAYRPFGAIFKESFRAKFGLTSILTGNHPLKKLYDMGSELAKNDNAAITYLIPDPRWERMLKIMPFETHKLPLWSCALPVDKNTYHDPKISVRKIDNTDAGIDELWMACPKENMCSLTRNAQTYQTKNTMNRGRYKLRGVYYDNKLIGIFTMDFKKPEHQWVLCDVLAYDNNEGLKITLTGAVLEVQAEYLEKQLEPDKPYKIGILATPAIQKVIKDLGFQEDNYHFTLAVQLLDKKNLSKADVSPKNWYISAND